MKVICLESLRISEKALEIPAAWEKYRNQWLEVVNEDSQVKAQLLIGCDAMDLHPVKTTK